MLSFITWTAFPEVFSLFDALTVRWYGLLWAIGFMLGYYVENKIYQRENLPEGTMDKVFLFMVFGTIIGARVGHCFFYEWDYFTEHPLEVLYVWKGGLSSHGGAFGILISLFIFSRNIHKSYLWVLDRIIIAVAICGACIRFGNLMNHEIYGDPTTMPWGFSFMLHPFNENSPMSEPSHPTQIYEMLYCLFTFAVTLFLYWKTEARKRTGLIFGVFLICVFFTRFMLEFIKRPQEDFESDMLINMGQILSIPFFVAGFALIVYNLLTWNKVKAEPVDAAQMLGGILTKKQQYASVSIILLCAVLAMAMPLSSRAAELAEMKAKSNGSDETVHLELMDNMTSDQCLDYLSKTKFVSEYGLELTVNHGYIYINGQKFAGPIAPNPSVQDGQYYILAKGVKKGSNHYVLRTFKNHKSVLINVDDVRGNYHEVAE